MPKRFVIGWVVLALAMLAPAALAQGEGVIEAQVVNGTEGGSSVGGLTVTLRAFQGMVDELEPRTARADAEGLVRFEGLDTSPDVTYILETIYEDVEYSSLPLNFEEGGEMMLFPSFYVYEKTEEPDETDIWVERMHVFVDFEDGVMSIGELHIFVNNSDRTFFGVEDPELGQRVTLYFALPEGATELRFQMGGEGDRYVATADGFADTEALRPGTGQQILYGYTLSYGDADTLDLDRPLLYPTVNLNVLVPQVGVDVTSDQVELSEIGTVEGQRYLNLNGQDFSTGDMLSLHFAGLQGIVSQSATPATPATTQSGLDPKWIALALAALALVGGVIYPSLRRSRASVRISEPVASVEARRAHLLQAIADLDDAFEAGQIDETSYRQQRQALKSEALTLMQEL